MKNLKNTFFVVIALFTITAKAQTDNWTQYEIGGFDGNGVYIELPSYFSAEGSYGNPETQNFESYLTKDPWFETKVYVQMYGNNTKKYLETEYAERLKTDTGIKYALFEDNFFVISRLEGNYIDYRKTLYKNGKIYSLYIKYDIEQKQVFDNILTRISKSFK